jgi:hypothetical protein
MHVAVEATGCVLDGRQRDLERLLGDRGFGHAAEYGRG